MSTDAAHGYVSPVLLAGDATDALAVAEERYRRLEERFKALEEATGQLLWVTDAQGMVDDMPGWRAFTGATVAEVRGMGWLDTLHPADRPRALAAWSEAVRTRSPYQAEYRVRRHDGTYRWFYARGMPVLDEEGAIREWVGTSTDITDRKMAEAERAERANQLATTFAAITDGIFVYDPDGVIVMMNPAVVPLFGLNPDDDFAALTAQGRATLLHLRDAAGQPLAPDQLPTTRLLRGEHLATEVVLRRRDGHDAVMGVTGAPIRDGAGNITGAVAVYRDITTRKAMEQRTLAALNALLDMAQSLVQLPLGDASASSVGWGSVSSVNLAEMTRRVLHCDRVGIVALTEDGVPQPLAVAGLAPDDANRWWQEQTEQPPMDRTTPEYGALAQGQVLVLDFDQPPYNQAPNPYDIHTVVAAPLRLGDQLIGMLTLDHRGAEHHYTPEELRLVGALAQLTALIVEHERLLHAREEAESRVMALEAANARMDGFLHMVNHELKTPLTALRAYIDLAEQRARRQLGVGDAAQQRATQGLSTVLLGAKEQGQRLTRLLGDLLAASAVNADHMEIHLEACDMVALARRTVRQQRLLALDRQIHLHLPRRAGALLVRGDDLRLGQVLTNFLTNAVRYTPAETPIDVSLSATQDMVRVAVSDHGPGIAEADQSRIWERFERGPEHQHTGGGLGLGLFISRAIIALHGGQVGVAETPGGGATFWFALPRLSQDVAALHNH